MFKNPEFWEDARSSVDFTPLGIVRKLSPEDREVVEMRYDALRSGSVLLGQAPPSVTVLRADVMEFASRLGATGEEVVVDFLIPWGLMSVKPVTPALARVQVTPRTSLLDKIRSLFNRIE